MSFANKLIHTANSVSAKSIRVDSTLRVAKKKCNTSLVLQLGPLIEVNEVPSNTKNKKYELDSSVTDLILKDTKNYGPIVHVCRVGCTDKHLALCSKTRHREDTACTYPANQYIKRRTIEESVAAHERSMSSRSTSDLYKEAKLLVERTTDFDSSIWGAGHHHGVTYSMVRNIVSYPFSQGDQWHKADG